MRKISIIYKVKLNRGKKYLLQKLVGGGFKKMYDGENNILNGQVRCLILLRL